MSAALHLFQTALFSLALLLGTALGQTAGTSSAPPAAPSQQAGVGSHAPALPLPQLVQKAELGLYARVLAPQETEAAGARWWVYPLDVQRTLWGDVSALPREVAGAAAPRPALWVLQGVSGAPRFEEGEDLVLLLYASRMDSPLVGFWQGVWRVKEGRVQQGASTATAPDNLEDFVATLMGLRGQP